MTNVELANSGPLTFSFLPTPKAWTNRRNTENTFPNTKFIAQFTSSSSDEFVERNTALKYDRSHVCLSVLISLDHIASQFER